MKSIVSVRSISGATTNAIKHHVMGCFEDGSPDTILLHHGTNDLRSEESVNKYDRKGKESNVILKKNVMIKTLLSLIMEI